MTTVRYDTLETFRATQKLLPDSLPYPTRPNEPNWFEIGWEFLRGRNINEVIWSRWTPPRSAMYAESGIWKKGYPYPTERKVPELGCILSS